MLLTVLAIGGAILGATSIAGLLMLYQIRTATDVAHSAQAIFAADAGTEWAKYVYYCQLGSAPSCPDPTAIPTSTVGGATVAVTCYDANGALTPCYATTTTPSYNAAESTISKGTSLNSVRAFFLNLAGAQQPVP